MPYMGLSLQGESILKASVCEAGGHSSLIPIKGINGLAASQVGNLDTLSLFANA